MGTVFAGARVDENVPLAPLTTLRVGPVASRVITCTSTEQVVATLRHLDGAGAGPLLVLAGGSNVVIADALTDLTVIRLANNGIRVDGNTLRAEAGAVWDDVVVAAIDAGLGGLECLSGIPGSAGATPVQNVGAYGVEVADTITRVRLLDRRSGEVRWTPADELGFGYRTSVLKHSDAATVLEVEFALDATGRSAPLRYGELVTALDTAAGERADPAAVRQAVLALRAGKGMVLDAADHDTWSVGSFFTNPVVTQQVYQELADRTDRPVAALSGAGRRQAGRGLARRAGRLRQGLPGRRRRRGLPAVHQARAGADQSGRGQCRRRAGAGPDRARRCARCVWRHTGTRAGAGRLLPVDHTRRKRVVFRRYLDVVDHRARRLAGHPAPGPDDPGGRRLRARRAGRLRRRVVQAGRQGQATGGSRADVPAGRQDHQGAADGADQRRSPRRLVSARLADQRGRQGGCRHPQPRPDDVHDHRAAGLRRDLHLERVGGRP